MDRIVSAEIRDATEDIRDRGGVVGVHIPPDGGGERPPGRFDALLFRIRAVGTAGDVRMAARLVLAAVLIVGAAAVAGTAIRMFLATSGFRAW
jgi:hypothetical protein